VVVKYLGGIFIHIQRQLHLHGVKNIDEARKKDLYIELDSKKGKQHMGQEETNKKRDKKMVPHTKKGGILIDIANIVMWMGHGK
jgi:hypothetical protein